MAIMNVMLQVQVVETAGGKRFHQTVSALDDTAPVENSIAVPVRASVVCSCPDVFRYPDGDDPLEQLGPYGQCIRRGSSAKQQRRRP